MSLFKDLTGQNFGNWEVLEKDHSEPNRGWFWKVRCCCEAKTEKVIKGCILTNEDSTGCKNCKLERVKKAIKTHGMSTTPTYRAWAKIKQRCDNPKENGYENYGGRGISYDPAWKIFDNFLADMGEMPAPDHSPERIDVNGNYNKDNCKWIPTSEQPLNKRNSRFVEYKGERKNLCLVAKEVGIPQNILSGRLDNGMTLEEAINTPILERTTKFLYKGEELLTSELEKVAGIPNKTITERIRRGWSVEKAVETPLDTTKVSSNIEWEGKTWSLCELAKHVGISHHTLYGRLHSYGMTLEEAINTPVKKSGNYKLKE